MIFYITSKMLRILILTFKGLTLMIIYVQLLETNFNKARFRLDWLPVLLASKNIKSKLWINLRIFFLKINIALQIVSDTDHDRP